MSKRKNKVKKQEVANVENVDKKKSSGSYKKRSNIVVNYPKLQKILLYVVCALVIAVSIFNVVFNTARLYDTKNRIEKTEERIEQLKYMLENIDYFNEEYVYDKLLKQYERTLVLSVLNTLWSYEVYINDTLLANENYISLTDVEEGEEIEVKLIERMASTSVPYKLAQMGSSQQGDPSDELRHQFRITSNVNASYNFDEGKSSRIIDGRHYTSVENVLTYTFVKGDDDVTINIFASLAERLTFVGKVDFNYELILK